MYERMLDKANQPTFDEFTIYCGNTRELFLDLDRFLTEELRADKLLRFPYGNKYGWSYKYFIKRKHICDVFAEKDAFTIMVRLDNEQFESIYNDLLQYTREFIDHKYPCSDGGWIHYRVLSKEHTEDIKMILNKKVKEHL